ncbi:DUF397 domain-containing protein [Streptomyces sp. NPDC054864]
MHVRDSKVQHSPQLAVRAGTWQSFVSYARHATNATQGCPGRPLTPRAASARCPPPSGPPPPASALRTSP